ncbi:MAG: hypothetical protein M3Z21_00150 [Pseudomonadota bacterium]|nr:hypothetical protein [Pseudomonadota bacterium]
MTDKPHRTKTTGGLPEALELASQPNYLGDPEIVSAILRQFVFELTERMAKAPDPEAGAKADQEATYQYAGIFAGEDPAYTPLPWHTNGGLKQFMERYYSIQAATTKDAAAHEIAQLVISVYDAIQLSAEGRPEEIWQTILDDAIQHCTYMLCGMIFTGGRQMQPPTSPP